MDLKLSAAPSRMLLSNLDLSMPPAQTYITERRSVTYYPNNGNIFSPTKGVKEIRFLVTGLDSWLDPSSVLLQFKFVNNDANKDIYPLNYNPLNCFNRLRILSNGVVIEDITSYATVCNILSACMPYDKRMNDAVMGFGMAENSDFTYSSLNNSPKILKGSSRIVSCPILCGLFSQTRFLLLRYLNNLQIELTLVSNPTDCVLAEPNGTVPAGSIPNQPINVTTISTDWQIENAMIKCDVLHLDTFAENQYTQKLQNGAVFNIPFSSFVCQMQSTGNNKDSTISLARSFTRLSACYVTFYKTPYIWSKATTDPDNNPGVQTTTQALHLPLRPSTHFYHPQYVFNYGAPVGTINVQSTVTPFNEQQGFVTQYNIEPQFQLQIGNRKFPEQFTNSSSENYSILRKTMESLQPWGIRTLSINEKEYRTTKFIVCFDLRKINEYSQGLMTRSGDLLTLFTQGMVHKDNKGNVWDNTEPEQIFFTLNYDALLEINDQGCMVYD